MQYKYSCTTYTYLMRPIGCFNQLLNVVLQVGDLGQCLIDFHFSTDSNAERNGCFSNCNALKIPLH